MSLTPQAGILADLTSHARYLTFRLVEPSQAGEALARLATEVGDDLVIGLGAPLVMALGKQVTGLTGFPCMQGATIAIPATQAALWCWLKGDDPGVLLHRGHQLARLLAPAFIVEEVIDAFKYQQGRDLTGYEDGTENPQEAAAVQAAIVQQSGPGMDGSSFVAVQQWQHDFDRFHALSQSAQDNSIGRRQSDNEELQDAPESAHVKRTAQEDFDPQAFVVRRSMPWLEGDRSGLVFVAFGESFGAFEALLTRMLGLEDGVTDALFEFTRPLTGSYFWCPPVEDGQLDLRVLGL